MPAVAPPPEPGMAYRALLLWLVEHGHIPRITHPEWNTIVTEHHWLAIENDTTIAASPLMGGISMEIRQVADYINRPPYAEAKFTVKVIRQRAFTAHLSDPACFHRLGHFLRHHTSPDIDWIDEHGQRISHRNMHCECGACRAQNC